MPKTDIGYGYGKNLGQVNKLFDIDKFNFSDFHDEFIRERNLMNKAENEYDLRLQYAGAQPYSNHAHNSSLLLLRYDTYRQCVNAGFGRVQTFDPFHLKKMV